MPRVYVFVGDRLVSLGRAVDVLACAGHRRLLTRLLCVCMCVWERSELVSE